MPARLRLSWGMKTFRLFFLPVLESLEFGSQLIRYALIFASAFFRQRASLGCEMVAMRSQLTFYKESIRQNRQPRPRCNPAFRLLWVLLSKVWSGWKSAAELMTAWVIQQLREAMPVGQQPSYLFRDDDGIYGEEVGRFLAGWDCRSQNGPLLPLAKSIRGKVWRHPTARVVWIM
jgi:hypothetical protein